MARLLEDLAPGTPVVDRDGTRVGEVRGLYGLGESRAAEYLLIHWSARQTDALVPSTEVAAIGESVELIGSAQTYEMLPAYEPSSNPSLHAL